MLERLLLFIAALAIAGCVNERTPAPNTISPAQGRDLISRSLPEHVADGPGWAADIYADFTALGIEITPQNTCAVIAVIAQESNFQVDPIIPGLGAIAWREIDRRADRVLIPHSLVHSVLDRKSSDGRTYSARIDSARTEKDLSDVYEDFISSVPLGRSLFENHNPIRTRGPMQVNVAFADRFSTMRAYPFPVRVSVADELFTRRGSLYFGIAHLLAYRAPYDRYLYRFADYNAGQFSSRNAAFQRALGALLQKPLTPDGALLPHDGGGILIGDTESAARTLGARLDLSDADIHSALEQGRSEEFEGSALYRRTFALAEQTAGHTPPRAVVPLINLEGPKLSRKLTTEWYAHRVDDRFNRCLNPARANTAH
jgi:hypothetical protein